MTRRDTGRARGEQEHSAPGPARLRRRARIGLVFWLAVVLALTLWPLGQGVDIVGFKARALGDAVRNVALFVPLGVLFSIGFVSDRPAGVLRAGMAGALLSGAIELSQTLIGGRDPALADWIANSLGAVAGAAWPVLARLRPSEERGSLIRELFSTGLWLVFVALLLLGSSPGLGRGPLFFHVDHQLGYIAPIEGEVLEIDAGGRRRAQGWAQDLGPGDLPPWGGPPLRVRLRPAEASTMQLRSILIVSDADLNQTLLLGRRGQGLVVGSVTLGNAFGFGSVRGVWNDVFATSDEEMTIEMAEIAGSVCLALAVRRDSERDDLGVRCDLGPGLADAWSLWAASPLLVPPVLRSVLGVAWLWLLFVAAGLWFGGSPRSSLVGLVAVAGSLCLWVVCGPVRAPAAYEVVTVVGAYAIGLVGTALLGRGQSAQSAS